MSDLSDVDDFCSADLPLFVHAKTYITLHYGDAMLPYDCSVFPPCAFLQQKGGQYFLVKIKKRRSIFLLVKKLKKNSNKCLS